MSNFDIQKDHPEFENMHKAMLNNTNDPSVLVGFTYKGIEYRSRMKGGQELTFSPINPQLRPMGVDAAYGSTISTPMAAKSPMEETNKEMSDEIRNTLEKLQAEADPPEPEDLEELRLDQTVTQKLDINHLKGKLDKIESELGAPSASEMSKEEISEALTKIAEKGKRPDVEPEKPDKKKLTKKGSKKK